MIILPDREAITAARNSHLPNAILTYLASISDDLLDLTYVVILDVDETEHDIESACGFNPLINPIDGLRFDQAGFEPFLASVSRVAGYWVACHCVSNSGFAYLLVIPDGVGELQDMCRRNVQCA